MDEKLYAASERGCVVVPSIVAAVEFAQNRLRDRQVEGTNAVQCAMALRWDARQVLLPARVDDPVVAGERGTALEEPRRPIDDGRVAHAKRCRRLDVAGDELLVWHIRLQRQIGSPVLRVAA